MGKNAFDAVDAAVDGDDRDTCLDRLFDGGRQRVDVKRRDDDGVDLLHDGRFDVGGLLGGLVLAVALDQIDAFRIGLCLDLLQHVHEEREGQVRDRAEDGQLVLREGAGCSRDQRTGGHGRNQKLTSVHGVILLLGNRSAAMSHCFCAAPAAKA